MLESNMLSDSNASVFTSNDLNGDKLEDALDQFLTNKTGKSCPCP